MKLKQKPQKGDRILSAGALRGLLTDKVNMGNGLGGLTDLRAGTPNALYGGAEKRERDTTVLLT